MTEKIVNPLAYRESWFCSSVFNHTTRFVVAEYARKDGQRTTSSLYFRDPTTRLYERLPIAEPGLSFCSPVVPRCEPYVFFNVMRISEAGVGDWLHIARAHIHTRRVEIVLTPDELVLALACSPEWRMYPWVSELVSAADDGRTITCRVGIPVPRERGAFRMHYWMCDLDVASRSVKRLVDLRAPPEFEA